MKYNLDREQYIITCLVTNLIAYTIKSKIETDPVWTNTEARVNDMGTLLPSYYYESFLE